MKSTKLKAILAIVAMIGVAGLILAGCSSGSRNDASTPSPDQASQKDTKAVRYTCPMHSEVLQDRPGDCPKCGMKLVEKH